MPNVKAEHKPTFQSTDARVLAPTARYLFTSPNMDFVPRFYPDPRPLQARGNGKFFTEDYTLHPQMHFEQYPWLPCIARPPDDPEEQRKHSFIVLWHDAPLATWEARPSHVFSGQGTMAHQPWVALRDIVLRIDAAAARAEYLRPPVTFNTTRTAMLAALERLCFLVMARSDFVLQHAQCQRMALDVDAMTKFLLRFAPRMRQTAVIYDADPDLMGCFTNNPTVAQSLHRAGIPFWLIRDIRDVPVGSIQVMAVTTKVNQSSYVYGHQYFDHLHPNPIYTPFEILGIYGHQVERIERMHTMGRMYSSLVKFEQGPQELVSEDIRAITSSAHYEFAPASREHVEPLLQPTTGSKRRPPDPIADEDKTVAKRVTEGHYDPYPNADDIYAGHSDNDQYDDILYPELPEQDSPTSPTPSISSRASSAAPSARYSSHRSARQPSLAPPSSSLRSAGRISASGSVCYSPRGCSRQPSLPPSVASLCSNRSLSPAWSATTSRALQTNRVEKKYVKYNGRKGASGM